MGSYYDAVGAHDLENRSPREAYPLGYQPGTVEYFANRRAARQAAFILPYLYAGLSLLDCGCGPREVVGIDIEPGQIEWARAYTAGRGLLKIPDSGCEAVAWKD